MQMTEIQEQLPSCKPLDECDAAIDSGALEDLDITIDSFRVWSGTVQDVEYNVEYDAYIEGDAISLNDYSEPVVIERVELEELLSKPNVSEPIQKLIEEISLYPNIAKGNIADMTTMLGLLNSAVDDIIANQTIEGTESEVNHG